MSKANQLVKIRHTCRVTVFTFKCFSQIHKTTTKSFAHFAELKKNWYCKEKSIVKVECNAESEPRVFSTQTLPALLISEVYLPGQNAD